MDMTIRAATPAERLYAYDQSNTIANQCGSPGYLHGTLGENDTVFLDRWESGNPSQNTPEFKSEFNNVLALLRFGAQYSHPLNNRVAMIAYCLAYPEAQIVPSREYAFRADTRDHAYLIRCTPNGTDDHVFIHPYRRDWLEHHMEQAEKGIRFVTLNGKEKFRIPDGDAVRIQWPDGSHIDHSCRYVDEYHIEVGRRWDSLCHLHQFAEYVDQWKGKVIPLRSSLPEQCHSVLPSSDEIIIIRKGESGCYHTDRYGHDRDAAQAIVDEYNSMNGVTKAQEAAMLAGSMFGWDTPAADPKNYDEQGCPIKPRHQDRGEAR